MRGLPEYFKCGKTAWRLQWAPLWTPLGELTALPQTLAGGEGLAAPSPRTSPLLWALQALNLMALGHSFHSP